MPVQRALVVFLVCAAAALAADPPELQSLKGDKFKGDLVGLTDKEIVLKVGEKPVSTPTDQTLLLQFGPVANVKDAKYAEVELVDGSVLRCGAVSFKGKDATLTLLSGQTVKVPLTSIAYVMNEANDPKLAAQWKELFAGVKKTYDFVVRKGDTGALAKVEGTFFDAADDGKTIAFTPRGTSDKLPILLERVHGMVFLRPPDPNQPSLLCKLYDTQGSTLMAKSAVLKDGTLTVTTQCGVAVDYAVPLLAKLDYSKGKLTYLSEIELARVKVEGSSPLGLTTFRRDNNLDGTAPIQLGGKTYAKGLSMHHHCEVTIDLEGEYREFKAVVGVDDRITQGSDSPTVLKIEGDGKELLSLNVTRKDGAKPITLNIREVQKLRIVVTSDDILGLGSHLALGDAKVSK
jgi:hypothetical protein